MRGKRRNSFPPHSVLVVFGLRPCANHPRQVREITSGFFFVETDKKKIFKSLHDSIKLVMTENGKDFELWKNWAKCGEIPFSDVSLHLEDGKAWFGGMCHCGSFSACPDCGRKIGLFKCAQIREGIHRWKQMNKDNEMYLLTFTMRHKKTDSIAELIKDIKDANARFFRDGTVRERLTDYGIIGRITSFEVKYNFKNGLHPHFHFGLFGKKGMDIKKSQSFFGDKWLSMLKDVQRDGLKDIACNLEDATHLHNYLTKMSSELSLGGITKDRGKGLTPFQLLYKYSIGQGRKYGKVFCSIVENLKGLSMIQWSRDLKSYLGLKDWTDHEIVDHSFDFDDLVLVLDKKTDIGIFPNDIRRMMIEDVEKGEIQKVLDVLDYFHVKYWLNREKAYQNE